MFRRAKITVVAAVVIAALLSPTAIANVDAKARVTRVSKIDGIKCKATKASAHEPKSIAPAEKLLKRFPRIISLDTNCGKIVITTIGAKAPITVTQIATLARGGFFDNTLCHRLTTEGIFVLQCGDPTATGSGGPNFKYPDENLPIAGQNNYPAGTVAMANSGAGTNGSQFFLVFADTTLGPNYTIWGTITQGLEIVKAIAKSGVKGGGVDGAPNQTIAINRATVTN